MIARLFTAGMGKVVANLDIPTFQTAPAVLVWGDRVFVSPSLSAEGDNAEVSTGAVAYVEAFAYFAPATVALAPAAQEEVGLTNA